jgi:hypothetical protein
MHSAKRRGEKTVLGHGVKNSRLAKHHHEDD